MSDVELPYQWRPRPYQERTWAALESGKKRVVSIWHRRAGKDMVALNWCATQAFLRTGLYWHVFPTYAQGRKVIWEGMDRTGRPFLDAFPQQTWHRKLDQEMTLFFHGGSKFQVVGTDHIDRLVGANPVGLIMSEYALQNPAAWELLSPILAENDGWAIFPYTPRGKNHGYHLYQFALKHPETWHAELLTVDDTDAVPREVLEEERERMNKALFEQEFFSSFNAAMEGSYYGEQLSWMREQTPPRISDKVTWAPNVEVVTGWDLGYGDATAVWFAQVIAGEVRMIDYYENSGEPIDHYVKVMREKPYVYGDAYLPHDAGHMQMQTGRSTIDILRSFGLSAMLNPKIGKADKIEAARLLLRNCWMNEESCNRGIEALGAYVKVAIEGELGPSGERVYRDQPKHNWASHGADAFAELAIGYRPDRQGAFRQPDASYVT